MINLNRNLYLNGDFLVFVYLLARGTQEAHYADNMLYMWHFHYENSCWMYPYHINCMYIWNVYLLIGRISSNLLYKMARGSHVAHYAVNMLYIVTFSLYKILICKLNSNHVNLCQLIEKIDLLIGFICYMNLNLSWHYHKC